MPFPTSARYLHKASAGTVASRRSLRLRLALAAAFLPASLAAAQLPASAPSTASTASPPADAATRPQHRSQVTFAGGILTVVANNASLNSIIRDIAQQTGMKISGTVAEDRVFGTYGPGDPQRVLATLLDGTGSNFLIESSKSDAPVQLLLTRRTGAATPPNPNAASSRDDDDDQPLPPPPAGSIANAPRPRPSTLPGSIPSNSAATQPSTTDQTVVFPAVDPSSTPATAATNNPADPNNPSESSADSVKTPQQIFEQLQRLRQPATGATTTPQ